MTLSVIVGLQQTGC